MARIYRFDQFTLEPDAHCLLRSQEEITLRPKSFQTLVYLVEHKNRVVTKSELLNSVWSGTHVVESVVGKSVAEIRKALNDDVSKPRYVKTIPKLGYKWIANIESVPADNATPSIAVLAFKDMTPERNQAHFCEGMAEEVINALTHLSGVRVAARTSAFSFKDKDVDIREIGAKLNTEMLLEGSVRKEGDRLRLSAQLINAADGFHLWSGQFDRELDDALAIQSEIALKIVHSLRLQLAGKEKTSVLERHTDSVQAYHYYLMGAYLASKETCSDMMRAVEYYRKALEEDPDYPLAYAGMSLCYSHLAYWDYLPSREALPLAKKAAMRGFKLNNTRGEVLRSVALVKIYYEWDWEGADAVTKKALEVAPYSESSHTTREIFFLATGRLEGAIREGRRALEVDPLSITANSYLGFCFLRAGYLNNAVEQFRKTLELDPNHPRARWLLGQSLLLGSDVEEGLREIEKAVEQSERNPVVLSGLGWAYAHSGRRSAAQRVIQELEAMAKTRSIRPYLFAKIRCGLGQNDLAFEWLGKAFEEHDLSLTFLLTDECFETLRFDKRYSRFLARMKLIGPP